MDRKEAEEILEIMAIADGGCEYCVRKLYVKFIEKFPQYTYLARKMFMEKFNKDLIEEEKARELIKETIEKVLNKQSIRIEKIILFGSRAKKDYRADSDWDVLVIVRDNLSREEKNLLSIEISKELAQHFIPCDILIRTSEEVKKYAKRVHSITKTALKEGIVL